MDGDTCAPDPCQSMIRLYLISHPVPPSPAVGLGPGEQQEMEEKAVEEKVADKIVEEEKMVKW